MTFWGIRIPLRENVELFPATSGQKRFCSGEVICRRQKISRWFLKTDCHIAYRLVCDFRQEIRLKRHHQRDDTLRPRAFHETCFRERQFVEAVEDFFPDSLIGDTGKLVGEGRRKFMDVLIQRKGKAPAFGFPRPNEKQEKRENEIEEKKRMVFHGCGQWTPATPHVYRSSKSSGG